MRILTSGNYYGSKKSKIDFGGIILSQYDYLTPCTDWHYHENPYFMYVLQGNMMDSNKKVQTQCPSGSLMFNNWQEPHYGSKHSEKACGFHLEFEKDWFAKNGISTDLLEGSQLIQNPVLHVLFAKLYHEFIVADDYTEISIQLLLIEISEALSSLQQHQTNQHPLWVHDLKELLHFDSSHLSLDYLSKELNIHPVHISRAASKYLSVSLGEYLRQQKVKKALPLLLNAKRSLTQVAYEAGFSDQSHFNRVFKSYFKTVPSSYRKSIVKFLEC